MNTFMIRTLGWLILGVILIFLAMNRHSRSGRFNYHSEVFSDKAGYHIYLSATEYGWDWRNFPDTQVASFTGYGFELYPEGKIYTKYTYGTALAYAPFYLLGTRLEEPDEAYPGFSEVQNRMISLAAGVYLFIGLFFLFHFLKPRYGWKAALGAMTVVLLGTNLLYYGIQETGMSHVYSFALFAFFLWFLDRTAFMREGKWWHFLLFGMMAGWMAVIRQLNIFFPLVYFFLDNDQESPLIRLKRLLRGSAPVWIALGGFLLLFPQLLYWKYVSGHWLMYSYGEEGFNWLCPKLLNVWFAPHNGLFIYTPTVLFILAGVVWMIRKGENNGWLLLLFFAGMSYLFASWWAWWFGCAFGARSFIEYYTLLALAVAFSFRELSGQKPWVKKLSLSLLAVCCLYTLKLTFSIYPCFQGEDAWDWGAVLLELKTGMH